MDPVIVVAAVLAALCVLLSRSVIGQRQADRRARTALQAESGTDLASAALRLRNDLVVARAQSAASSEALAQMMEVAGPGILVVEPDLRISNANPAAHALLRRAAGTLEGRTVMEAFLEPAVESAARAAMSSGTGETEIRLAGADGPAVAIRARRSPTGAAWLLLDDVSELRRLQRIRAEFIDNLSHELRTPLTTVSLLAETLSRDVATEGDAIPDKMRDRIAKIEVETGHLVQMVNELMDLSRIESGGTVQLRDGVDLGRLAADAADRLRLFAERQGVDLRVEPGDGLPTVRGDAPRLGQVVVNLVHNAVKFSPDGGSVTVRTSAMDDDVVVSVQDHGVGIPVGVQDRIFERFYKVDRARQRPEAGGGTGLGLAIARHVVEQHGGRIWVESREGVGSTFHVALPAATDPTTETTD
ncbi:MAG: ATP-binding protein [Chloroflexota bacterium]